MAAEWVDPLVTGMVGVIGAAVGAAGTWWTGKQTRDQALAMLEQQLGHERLQAREVREQERLESAYLELLKMAEQVGQWAQFVYPLVQTGSLPETPLPSLESQADVAALMAAFGTSEVAEKSEAWQSVVRQMINQAELIHYEEQHPPQPGDPALQRPAENSPRVVILRLRPEELKARRALEAQVRTELAFGYRSTRKPSGFIRSFTMPSAQESP